MFRWGLKRRRPAVEVGSRPNGLQGGHDFAAPGERSTSRRMPRTARGAESSGLLIGPEGKPFRVAWRGNEFADHRSRRRIISTGRFQDPPARLAGAVNRAGFPIVPGTVKMSVAARSLVKTSATGERK